MKEGRTEGGEGRGVRGKERRKKTTGKDKSFSVSGRRWQREANTPL